MLMPSRSVLTLIEHDAFLARFGQTPRERAEAKTKAIDRIERNGVVVCELPWSVQTILGLTPSSEHQ